MKKSRPLYSWDEDSELMHIKLNTSNIESKHDNNEKNADTNNKKDEVEVHWTPEGGLEVMRGHYTLTAQLAGRVDNVTFTRIAEEVHICVKKHVAQRWGRVWLTDLDDDDLDVHLRRERGWAQLATASINKGNSTSNSNNNSNSRVALLRRFRPSAKLLRIPLGCMLLYYLFC
jgi:hypothetical protein